ncbi:MAG: GNAT family N-acetyltransferase [Candidatus Hodarchaeales archaeon]
MIKGKNIHLRVIERDDLETLRSWFNNPALRGMEGVFLPISELEMEEKYKEMLEQKEAIHLIIEKRDRSKIYGKIAIYYQYGGLDLLLPGKDGEHEKAALEALELGLSDLFLEKSNRNCVSMWIPSWNHFLLNVAKKAGMKIAGTLRRTGMREGKYVNTIVHDILKEEFLEKSNKQE